MASEEVTLALFAACNGVRIVAYLPQLYKAATDENGAAAISCTTWALFLVAHLSTVTYALVNQADWGLAVCFAGNAACCVAILAVTWRKRRAAAERTGRQTGADGITLSKGVPAARDVLPRRAALRC